MKLSRKDYDVKYLNLSNCRADEGVLGKLISSCQSLQKLSLARLSLSSDAINSCNYEQIQTLDLNSFRGLDLELMKNILSCKALTEFSFRNHPIQYNSDWLVQYFVENVSSDVEKVSIGGMTCLNDKHVKILVKRCKKIKELELCGCRSITGNSLTSIARHSEQLVKLDVSMASIFGTPEQLPLLEFEFFFDFKSRASLKVLNCQHPKRSPPEIGHLRKLMPQVIINLDAFGGDLGIANPNKHTQFSDRTQIQTFLSNESFDPNQITTKPEFGLWEKK